MTLPADQCSQTVYHLQTAPGDLAPFILTSGSTHRIRRLATFFDDVRLERPNREFLTITGTYKNIPVTGLATGIGAPPTIIAIVEALQCQQQATFIRLGSCGSLQPHIQIGDLIISNKALRREFVTQFYAPPEIEAAADPDITAALTTAARQLGINYHTGLTYTAAIFTMPKAGRHRVFPAWTALLFLGSRLRMSSIWKWKWQYILLWHESATIQFGLEAVPWSLLTGTGTLLSAPRTFPRPKTFSAKLDLLAVEILAGQKGKA